MLVLGGSLLVTGLVFSFMGGIFHPYYTVGLAPYIAGLVGIGAGLLWQRRGELAWRMVAAAVVALLAEAWSFALLSQASSWQPWIRWVVVAATLAGAVLVLLPPRGRGLAGATVATVLVAALLGPTAFSVQTTTVGHRGAADGRPERLVGRLRRGPRWCPRWPGRTRGQGGPGGQTGTGGQTGPGGQDGIRNGWGGRSRRVGSRHGARRPGGGGSQTQMQTQTQTQGRAPTRAPAGA